MQPFLDVRTAVLNGTVSFPDRYRMQVAGNLVTPKDLDRSARHPALVVGHPKGAVKEQSANLYATKMAEAGYLAMSIDLPFCGESKGQPRNAVSPDLYAEAFSAGVDFFQTQAVVDPDRIGGIGICGSGSGEDKARAQVSVVHDLADELVDGHGLGVVLQRFEHAKGRVVAAG